MSSLLSENLAKLLEDADATRELYQGLISAEQKNTEFKIQDTNFTVTVGNILDKKPE